MAYRILNTRLSLNNLHGQTRTTGLDVKGSPESLLRPISGQKAEPNGKTSFGHGTYQSPDENPDHIFSPAFKKTAKIDDQFRYELEHRTFYYVIECLSRSTRENCLDCILDAVLPQDDSDFKFLSGTSS